MEQLISLFFAYSKIRNIYRYDVLFVKKWRTFAAQNFKNKYLMKLNTLGLNKADVEKEIGLLNVLLANYQTYYQNLRGVHWNIKGKRFFELHVKFEELYTTAQEQVDEIAERILTLGGVPFHTLESYVKHASVPVGENIFDDEKTVRLVIDTISALLPLEREILDFSDEINDEGTNSLMSDFISGQEKNVWMLKAYLNEVI